MFVLDTELDTYQRLNEDEGLENLEITGVLPDDWEVISDTAKNWVGQVEKNDWVVVDSTSPTWNAVQDWFTREIFDAESMAEYFMEKRKGAAAGARNLGAFDGWVDWQVINAQYTAFMNNLLKCTSRGAHLLLTAEVDKIGDGEDSDLRAMFGKVGVKPRGQKRLPHIPHSTVWMKRLSNGWTMQTVKEQGRHRDEMENVEVVNFAKQYLQGVAGWVG